MGLDFTTIKDEPGAAVFMIHDGSHHNEQQTLRLAETVRSHTSHQVVVLSDRDLPAIEIKDFYDLQDSNCIIVVGDDDQLRHMWHANEIPNAEQIAFTVNQIG